MDLNLTTTPVGLTLENDISFEDWAGVGERFGSAIQRAAWCIGDWMLYGEKRWAKNLLQDPSVIDCAAPQRIASRAFDLAVAATGLDRQTISKYAEVCRKIPVDKRSGELSFAHHRVLAPLPEAQRDAWVQHLTDSESVNNATTVKRLALSVRMSPGSPKIISDEEITGRNPRAGRDNYIPHLTRLLTVLRSSIPDMGDREIAALKEDVAQLLELLEDAIA